MKKQCGVCENSFETNRKNQKYCCSQCAWQMGEWYYRASDAYYRLRYKILLRDNFTCQYCGNKPNDCKLHIDHIIPKSKGGNSSENNLITSCEYCNNGKADILLNKHDIEKIKRLAFK